MNIIMPINLNSNTNKTSVNVCNNCGKQGHQFHQCKLPITSYGVVVFRSGFEGIEFLMLRRKDTFGYIDFIRGKYSPYNIDQVQKIIDEMSLEEKDRILREPFEQLWKTMWNGTTSSQYRNEEIASFKKFETLKNGVYANGLDKPCMTLKEIIERSSTQWKETEWEFPKGRRNYQEKDLDCALREFEEETGIIQKKLCVIENVLPFEEIFMGTNHKSYKHKYFLAYLNEHTEELNNFQKTEVSKLEWKTLNACLESIRPYNLEKKQLIINIHKVLQEYRLYS